MVLHRGAVFVVASVSVDGTFFVVPGLALVAATSGIFLLLAEEDFVAVVAVAAGSPLAAVGDLRDRSILAAMSDFSFFVVKEALFAAATVAGTVADAAASTSSNGAPVVAVLAIIALNTAESGTL